MQETRVVIDAALGAYPHRTILRRFATTTGGLVGVT
jgi:hypothetical protein